jgi:hypothetical protein
MSGALTLLFLLNQQDPATQQEFEKALQQDQAARQRAGQPPAGAPAPAAPPAPTGAVTPLPGNAPDALAASNTQLSVQKPGATLLNPAVSVILDADFGYYGRHRSDFDAAGLPLAGDDPAAEGFGMQEVEVGFQSAIDPYLEGALFLTIPNLDGLEVEEGYIVTTSLPYNLQIKAGSFRSQLGRNNTQHLHLQSFPRRPLLTPLLLGADGLRGPGAQLSVLFPLPWFATFYVEALAIGAPDDRSRVTSFGGGGRSDPENLTYTAVLEQYWDLSESTSLLLGLNFATGKAFACPMDPCAPAARDYLYGGDLYLKWKPPNVVHTYASLQWTTEYLVRTIADGGPTEGAFYTEPLVQVARRFWIGARLDVTGLPEDVNLPRRYGLSGSLTFTPSEFSRVRGYVQEIFGPEIPSSTVGFLQVEVSLGAHGAHPF